MSALVREEASVWQHGGNHCCWPLLSRNPNRKRLHVPRGRPESEGAETGMETRPPRPSHLCLLSWPCACACAYQRQVTAHPQLGRPAPVAFLPS